MGPLAPAWKDHGYHIAEQDVQEKCHSGETGKYSKCQVNPSSLWIEVEETRQKIATAGGLALGDYLRVKSMGHVD